MNSFNSALSQLQQDRRAENISAIKSIGYFTILAFSEKPKKKDEANFIYALVDMMIKSLKTKASEARLLTIIERRRVIFQHKLDFVALGPAGYFLKYGAAANLTYIFGLID